MHIRFTTMMTKRAVMTGLISITCLGISASDLPGEEMISESTSASTKQVHRDSVASTAAGKVERRYRPSWLRRWNIYGYAEVSAQRNFSTLGSHHANPVGDFPSWQMTLPKAHIWITFDCGKGWSVGTEMGFENDASVASKGPGRPSSRNVDWDMSYELCEFWVQKSFSSAANLKIGYISTPVGQKNDLPTDFFGVVRPEDGPSYLPLDYSTFALDFNGESDNWNYEVMAIPGLTGYDFGNSSWHFEDGSFEQSLSRLYAGAFRIGNTSVEGLELALSGEFGGGNTWIEYGDEEGSGDRRDIRNSVSLASFDFRYDNYNWIARGAFQYGYIGNSTKKSDRTLDAQYGKIHDMQAMSASGEVGYDFFSLSDQLAGKQKFYVFGRYSWTQHQNWNTELNSKSFWSSGQRFSFGVNWMPIPTIIVKGECGFGFGNDPTRSILGVSIGWCPST